MNGRGGGVSGEGEGLNPETETALTTLAVLIVFIAALVAIVLREELEA